jgi:hypothetical protein
MSKTTNDVDQILADRAQGILDQIEKQARSTLEELADQVDFNPQGGHSKGQNLGTLLFGGDRDLRAAVRASILKGIKDELLEHALSRLDGAPATKPAAAEPVDPEPDGKPTASKTTASKTAAGGNKK